MEEVVTPKVRKPRTPKVTEKPFLFVDLSNLVYKNTSTLNFLRSSSGVATGGVYGTLRSLISWSKKFNVWVFADGINSSRRELVGGYKVGRTDSQLPTHAAPVPLSVYTQPSTPLFHPDEIPEADIPEFGPPAVFIGPSMEQIKQAEEEFAPTSVSLKKLVYSNINKLTEVLSDFGFPVVHHADFEADDLIGAAVYLHTRLNAQTKGHMQPVYILSTDKDFDQLPVGRITSLKAHGKYASPEHISPIKDTYLMGAGTLACFPEVPSDSLLRTNPHFLTIYRSIVGDASDRIKGIMTPLRAWKKKVILSNSTEEMYVADGIIQAVATCLQTLLPMNPYSYIEFVWALDKALSTPECVAQFQEKLEGTQTHLDAAAVASLLTNLKVTKIPINLMDACGKPQIKVITEKATFTAPLAHFFLHNKLPEFQGWLPDMQVVKSTCLEYQMPSLHEAISKLELVTKSHLTMFYNMKPVE